MADISTCLGSTLSFLLLIILHHFTIIIIQIHGKSFVTTSRNASKTISIPSDDPMIAGYVVSSADMTSNGTQHGKIFLRETSEYFTLRKINHIVDMRFQTNFKSKIGIIITFVNMTSASNPNLKNTFQVVIGSDNITTFVIFNYIQLNINDAVAGFSGSKCNSHQLTTKEESKQLVTKSNVFTNGTFVFKLNPSDVQCPSQSKCHRTSGDILNCRCETECDKKDNIICGTNKVTYRSMCHMKKAVCDKYGATSVMNISVAHEGACNSKYTLLISTN